MRFLRRKSVYACHLTNRVEGHAVRESEESKEEEQSKGEDAFYRSRTSRFPRGKSWMLALES